MDGSRAPYESERGFGIRVADLIAWWPPGSRLPRKREDLDA
jgi:hypothetical protein